LAHVDGSQSFPVQTLDSDKMIGRHILGFYINTHDLNVRVQSRTISAGHSNCSMKTVCIWLKEFNDNHA